MVAGLISACNGNTIARSSVKRDINLNFMGLKLVKIDSVEDDGNRSSPGLMDFYWACGSGLVITNVRYSGGSRGFPL